MIDNVSTGYFCSEEQLKAFWDYEGYSTPIRRQKNHYALYAHGVYKCIGIATFLSPYSDSIFMFNALILKDADAPLILGLRDMYGI